ncbi:MAG TPA: hypothetical protein VMD75_16060 [Candidatus Binataceae bacterium]|nr:hypothetical protein [Candidatus Binataceae bacterium]
MKTPTGKICLYSAIAVVVSILSFLLPAPGGAQSAAPPPPAPSSSLVTAVQNYFLDWFPRVTRIQSEQPHWVTPLVTVTPRLEEEFRYDQYWQSEKHGVAVDNFGGGKGLELIPYQNIEIILGVPAWIAHNGTIQHAVPPKKIDTDGWADETFLVKYRILSANEENGNYILTAFMGFSAPTGDDGNSMRHGVFTPTIAGGKGFGNFDIQSTAGISLPDGGLQRLGMPLAWNTTFQYHVFKFFWPEFETNYTWWPNGEREGESQLYLTPGLMIGRIPIYERVGLTFGAGFQVAVTHHPGYNNAVVFSGRIPF